MKLIQLNHYWILWILFLMGALQVVHGSLLCKDNVTTSTGMCCDCLDSGNGSIWDHKNKTCVEECPPYTFKNKTSHNKPPAECRQDTTTVTTPIMGNTTEARMTTEVTDIPGNTTLSELSDEERPGSDYDCIKCNDACMECSDETIFCIQCAEGYKRNEATGECWSDPWPPWKIAVVVVAVSVPIAIFLVVLVVFLIRKRKKLKKQPKKPPGIHELDPPVMKNLSTDIQRRHDSMSRYRPDPTSRRNNGNSRSARDSVLGFLRSFRRQEDPVVEDQPYDPVEFVGSNVTTFTTPQHASSTSQQSCDNIYYNEENAGNEDPVYPNDPQHSTGDNIYYNEENAGNEDPVYPNDPQHSMAAQPVRPGRQPSESSEDDGGSYVNKDAIEDLRRKSKGQNNPMTQDRNSNTVNPDYNDDVYENEGQINTVFPGHHDNPDCDQVYVNTSLGQVNPILPQAQEEEDEQDQNLSGDSDNPEKLYENVKEMQKNLSKKEKHT